MSVYATIINQCNDDPWYLSINVVHDEDPVRINHGDAEWYLTLDEVNELARNLVRYGFLEVDRYTAAERLAGVYYRHGMKPPAASLLHAEAFKIVKGALGIVEEGGDV